MGMGGRVYGKSGMLRLRVQILPSSKTFLVGIDLYGSFPFGIGTIGSNCGSLSSTGILAIFSLVSLLDQIHRTMMAQAEQEEEPK